MHQLCRFVQGREQSWTWGFWNQSCVDTEGQLFWWGPEINQGLSTGAGGGDQCPPTLSLFKGQLYNIIKQQFNKTSF